MIMKAHDSIERSDPTLHTHQHILAFPFFHLLVVLCCVAIIFSVSYSHLNKFVLHFEVILSARKLNNQLCWRFKMIDMVPIRTIILTRILQWTYDQFRYNRNYRSNFNKLKEVVDLLEMKKCEIEHAVQEAENNGEEIQEHVKEWLYEADIGLEEVINFIWENDSSMKCFNGLCPDLRKRYRFNKHALEKINEMIPVIYRGEHFSRISYTRMHRYLSPEFNEAFESRMTTLNEVIDALKHVKVVGIYGLGGIGKTTLAKEVGERVRGKLFDYVVFVEVTEKPDAEKIRGTIADMLNLKLTKDTSSELYEMLEKKTRVLIILDNIWNTIDLQEVGIPLSDGDKGCRLLLTTRETRILSDMNCQRKIPINVLNEKESWDLFEKTVGTSVLQQSAIESIANHLVQRCGGLPIAIVTIAKALEDQPVNEWIRALNRLEVCQEDEMEKVYSYILLSYEHLNSKTLKSTFLLCSIIAMISEPSVENLLRYGMRLNLFRPSDSIEHQRINLYSFIRKLKECYLLLEISDDKIYAMRAIVRDIGTRIIAPAEECFIGEKDTWRQKMNDWDKLTWVFLVDMTELPCELNFPKLKFLYLETKNGLSMTDNFFSSLPKLEVIHIEGLTLKELPKSLISLEELGVLYMKHCKLMDLSVIGGLKNLEVLVLSHSELEEMIILPEQVGRLSRLRLLDLTGSKFNIIPSRVISRLTQLEELYLEPCTSIDVEQLKVLCRLTALHVRVPDAGVEVLSKSTVFQNLQRYNIVIGAEEKQLFQTESSRALQIASNTNISWQAVIQQFTRIEILILQGEHISSICSASSSFRNLKILRIEDCRTMVSLVPVSVAESLTALEEMSIRCCEKMEQIVETEGEAEGVMIMSRLKTLILEKLDKLTTFYSGNYTFHFPVLEGLKVSGCPNFTSFSSRAFAMPNLERIVNDRKTLKCKDDGLNELISQNKENWHLANEFNEDFESRITTLNSVIDALKDVKVVGIYGSGGIGKTTLAKEVGRKVKEIEQFDYVVVVEVTGKPDAEKIQDGIADMLDLKLREQDPSARAAELHGLLKNKRKVLLILDNIIGKFDLKKVGIPLDDDNKSCRLLLTTRKRDVLREMDCPENFHLDVLDKKDSWMLFAKTAGCCVEHREIQSIAREVADRCGGLPMAIVIVAKALRNKSVSSWRNAFQQIQPHIWNVSEMAGSCIRWRFDNLKSNTHRSIFLLCSMMASISETSIEDVLKYGLSLNMFNKFEKRQQSRDRLYALLEDFRECFLLLESSNDEIFSIHDVVREVGTGTISVDREYHIFRQLPLRSSLNFTWIFLVDIDELPNELNCPNLTFFYLKSKARLSVPPNFFQKMPKLEVVHMEGLDLLELPQSLVALKKLQGLHLKSCYLKDICKIEAIENLEILVISHSQSEITKWWDGVDSLRKLKWLDLRGNAFTIPQSVISRLTQLEELYIEKQDDGDAKELKDLQRLTTLHVGVPDAAVENLSKSTVFRNLERYNLVLGDQQKQCYIPKRSRTLQVVSNAKFGWKTVIQQFRGIEILVLKGEHIVNNTIHELCTEDFSCLEMLILENLVNLEKIYPDGVWLRRFSRLKKIEISGCHKLKYLFSLSIAKQLLFLEEIEVRQCDNMEAILTSDRIETPEFCSEIEVASTSQETSKASTSEAVP